MSEKPHLSPSKVNRMLTRACHVEALDKYGPAKPGIALVLGSSLDKVATRDWEHKISTGADLPQEALDDLAADTARAAWSEGVALGEDDPDETKAPGILVDSTVRGARVFGTRLAPLIQPRSTQERMEIDAGRDYSILGIPDVETVDNEIHDLKTRMGRPVTAAKLAEWDFQLQAQTYTLLHAALRRKPLRRFVLDFVLVGGKKDDHVQKPLGPYGHHDFETLLRLYDTAWKLLQARIYVPVPAGHWRCSKKYCGWYDRCTWPKRGDSRPKS